MAPSPDPPVARRRAARGEGPKLREQLLEAAEELLLASGDEQDLTIRAVAAKVGVTSPSVYRHFADKDALVDAVCLRAWDELARSMDAALDRHEDPFQAMRHLGAAYISWGLAHATQYRLLLLAPATGGSERPAAADACLRHLERAVAPCVEQGVLHGDVASLTLTMWAALHGYVALRITQPGLPWDDDPDVDAQHVARMAGLGSALLTRIERAAPERPPASERYVAVLDDAVARLLQ